ncbi:FAD-dependent oxidoreductase [Hoeflea poritis]|uniref:D-amino-acid oxidase n=1 Tax=Hoeflea poritis TaxID=2993659 RepID=A0ABT4VHQ2_9HYPH|nr:FAD-dependent oxidoreductase [Hoeflea poritis]MDA4844244.1 FAD-dependent oxidoreductase [Hoeflea poritis]
MKVLIKGAGVAGLASARELCRHGADVTVTDRCGRVGGAASWYAGGMLAPWCEGENADEKVTRLGIGAADWWAEAAHGHVERMGTLVVAPVRDRAELDRFAVRTCGHKPVDEGEIGVLEPVLAGRFRRGLFFENEAHLDPRAAMRSLQERLVQSGCRFHLDNRDANMDGFDAVIDCTGMASPVRGLRGVRGEMLILKAVGLHLSRPVRLLHPRIPVYVVPRGNGFFMVGATMVESTSDGGASARSVMELLNAAYALHPAFGDAEIVEIGVGVRPAFADNFPRVSRNGDTISINGLYRHGFLLAPALAVDAASMALKIGEAAHA